MPEEPDLSPEDIEILDQNLRNRIEAKKRQREANHIHAIAERIRAALHARPAGLPWTEIRGLFDNNHSDQQIRQALLTLRTTGLTSTNTEKPEEPAGERFFLAAS